MSVNIVNNDGSLSRVAGGTLYADLAVGSIVPFGGSAAPSGWMLCQGQAVSRTDYADLFGVIGTSFGTGDGSTTFNLPDLRGEFLRGAGTNSHTNQGNGGTVGQHQNATVIPEIEAYQGDTSTPITNISSGTSGTSAKSIENGDSKIVVQNIWINRITGTKDSGGTSHYDEYWAMRTVRPTNTSVNYIIKVMQVAAPADFMDAIDDALSEFAKSISLVPLNNSKIYYDKSRVVGGIVTVCASICVPSGNYLVKENAVVNIPSLGTGSIGYILPCLYRNVGNGAEEPGYVIIQTDGNLYPYYTKTEYNEIRINASYSSKV